MNDGKQGFALERHLPAAVRQAISEGLRLSLDTVQCSQCGQEKPGNINRRSVLRWQPFNPNLQAAITKGSLNSLAAAVQTEDMTDAIERAFVRAFPQGVPRWVLAAEEFANKSKPLGTKGNIRVFKTELLFKRVSSTGAAWPGETDSSESRVVDCLQLQHCLAQQGLAPAVYGCLTVGAQSPHKNNWLIMKFIKGPAGGGSMDLESGAFREFYEKADQERLRLNFWSFLHRALPWLAYYRIVHGDIRPANLVCTPELQFMLIDLEPFYCLLINYLPERTDTREVEDTIEFSNAINLLVASLGRLPYPLWESVYLYVMNLLQKPKSGQKVFNRCARWWWNSMLQGGDDIVQHVHTPGILAAHYLAGSERKLRAIDREVPELVWLPKVKLNCPFLESVEGVFSFAVLNESQLAHLRLGEVRMFVSAIVRLAAQETLEGRAGTQVLPQLAKSPQRQTSYVAMPQISPSAFE